MLRAMRLLYVLLLYLLAPGIWLWQHGRHLRLRLESARVRERFGHVPAPAEPVAVWVHAVSVGETLAALPLIRALVAKHGPQRVLVTSGTPTGSERVRAALADSVLHCYAPYDLPHVIRRFLNRMQPRQVVIMETELWPCLYRGLARRRVPLLIANARLSPGSFRGYLRVRRFIGSVLGDVQFIAAQSAADAERFRALGASRVDVTGNIKFDIQPDAQQVSAGRAFAAGFAAGQPVWIAASTHEGEETAALQAHRQLLAVLPQARLILVPRHPQRFVAVEQQLQRAGLRYTRRSRATEGGQAQYAQVLLGDSMGEMWFYLAMADLAFVGGSLAPVGGHNVLEPAALGLPVLFGPHMHNFIVARDQLLAAQGALQLADAHALSGAVSRLLQDAPERQRMGRAAQAALAANAGTLQRLLALLEQTA
jgi:3-deoxy-D-manno-octulosonic-acid transferase